MIKRTMNAALLNEVANLPEVRPWLGGKEGTIDLTAAAENPSNFVIEAGHGAWLLHPIIESVYEIHSIFAPEGRGKPFFAAAAEMLRFMFVETDALEIVTKCPDDNPAARMASRVVGFRERFRREDAWAPGVGVSFQVFSIDDWFVRDAECLAVGRAFHEMLETAKAEAGSILPVHPDDEAHDRAVGAAVLMARAGQMGKGVGFVNRWSAFAGYANIAAISPSVVNVRDALVEIRGEQMRVLRCPSVRLLESQELAAR